MRFGYRLAIAVFVVFVSHVGAFGLIYVVPRYKKTWSDLGTSLTIGERVLIEVSDVVARYWYLLLPPMVVAAALFVVLPMFWNQSHRRIE